MLHVFRSQKIGAPSSEKLLIWWDVEITVFQTKLENWIRGAVALRFAELCEISLQMSRKAIRTITNLESEKFQTISYG